MLISFAETPLPAQMLDTAWNQNMQLLSTHVMVSTPLSALNHLKN